MKSLHKTLGLLGIALTVGLAAPTVSFAQEVQQESTAPIVIADNFVIKAADAMAAKDYQNAVYHANKALDLDPNQAEALFLRGQARLQLGREEEAIKDLQQAAELFLQNNNQVGYQTAVAALSKV